MITPQEFARRRRDLMAMMSANSIAILTAAPERVRSRDTHFPYRQDSDFQYLCGFPEPEAVMVLLPKRPQGEFILFCRERDRSRELEVQCRARLQFHNVGRADAQAVRGRLRRGRRHRRRRR